MKNSVEIQGNEINRKPSVLQGRKLIERVVDAFGLKYVAHHMKVAVQTVAEWTEVTNNPIVRMRSMIHDIADEGQYEIANDILVFLCSALHMIPVRKCEQIKTKSSIIRAMAQNDIDHARVNLIMAEISEDGILELHELQKLQKELLKEKQDIAHIENQVEFLISRCESEGKPVRLEMIFGVVDAGDKSLRG